MLKLVYLGIGSNLNRRQNIKSAIADLKIHFADLQVSRVYQSPACGFTGNDFYNLVAGFRTSLEFKQLTEIIKAIEDKNGRIRVVDKFSDRSIDIDILLYGDMVMYGSGFDIPRQEIEKYPFVLKPLAELAPDLTHPVTGKTIADMWNDFANKDVITLAPEVKLNL